MILLQFPLSATECKATSADVVFVVDSSGSIGYENFKKIKIFLQSMANRLDIDRDLTRVGLMTFNDHAKWEFKLDQFGSKIDVLKVNFCVFTFLVWLGFNEMVSLKKKLIFKEYEITILIHTPSYFSF